MKDYLSTLDTLFELNRERGIKLGLENCQTTHSALGTPAASYPCIHIAGTNGKGSTAHKIAAALQIAGYRVGLFTSPHIACFRERIQVNGELIDENAVVIGVEEILSLAEALKCPLTFFETCSLLAFLYFKQQSVDVAVIEVGLGGRLDATTILHPILSIVTSIGLDHCQVLGHTLEAIAEEKLGIVKPRVPLLTGPSVPRHKIIERATICNSPWKQLPYLKETAEEENQRIASAALQQLEGQLSKLRQLSDSSRQKALKSRPPCRYELHKPPGVAPVILDVAHNPPGLKQLFLRLSDHYPHRKCHALVALSQGKDISACLAILKESVTTIHFTEAPNGRSLPVEILSETWDAPCLVDKDPHRCFRAAHLECGVDDSLLVVCGSFFIMAAVRQELGLSFPCDPFDCNEQASLPSKAGP